MKELRTIISTLSISRPIFRLTLSKSMNGYIEASTANPVYKYTPYFPDDKILENVVAHAYSETFDIKKGTFFIDSERILQTAMSRIRDDIGLFVERNLDMKSPRQSKLYRWVDRGMPRDAYFDNVSIMIFKYLRSFMDKSMRVTKDTDIKHVNNAIALLEAMEEKYNNE